MNYDKQWERGEHGEKEPEPGSYEYTMNQDQENNPRAVMVTNNGAFYPIVIKQKEYDDENLNTKKYTVLEIVKYNNLPCIRWGTDDQNKQNKISLIEFASISLSKKNKEKEEGLELTRIFEDNMKYKEHLEPSQEVLRISRREKMDKKREGEYERIFQTTEGEKNRYMAEEVQTDIISRRKDDENTHDWAAWPLDTVIEIPYGAR